MRVDVAGDIHPYGICFNRPQKMRRRQGRHTLGTSLAAGGDGKSSCQMADDMKRYWFIVAVFRDTLDLAATIGELHAGNFASGELLVLANRRAGEVRKAIHGRNGGFIEVFMPCADGGFVSEASPALPPSLSTLLDAMEQGAPSTASRSGSDGRQASSPVYTQLLKDVAGGAIILVASAADPEQQLEGARILLRGKCDCVLTHELTESDS